MGILIGGTDPAREIVDLQVRLFTAERLLEMSINHKQITQAEILEARKWAFDQVKAKYPQLGLEVVDAADK